MNFYTSDLHINHANIIQIDQRPFANCEEMLKVLIKNWNDRVTSEDTVYILGDFIWAPEEEWIKIVPQFNGKKVLIIGNHDLRFWSSEVRKLFTLIASYAEINDQDKKVLLCHYPIPFYKRDYDANTYMLYGHLHNSLEEKMMQEIKQYINLTDTRERGKSYNHFYNCWCGFYDYAPATLKEIIAKSQERITKHFNH